MKANVLAKLTNEEDREAFAGLVEANLRATIDNARYMGRLGTVANVSDGLLLAELVAFVADQLKDAGQTREEAEELVRTALDLAYADEDENEEKDEADGTAARPGPHSGGSGAPWVVTQKAWGAP